MLRVSGAKGVRLTPAKLFWGVICFALLVSHLWSISGWNEKRGVTDDVCYLRQAHLFQRFGLIGGLDSDVRRDDDKWLVNKIAEVEWEDGFKPTDAPCHNLAPATGKQSIQYPPGTGFVLSLFQPGSQVISLFMTSTIIIFLFALLAIRLAATLPAVIMAGAIGVAAIYVMINPVKASYSAAPSVVICAAAGLLTALFFRTDKPSARLGLSAAIGVLIGVSINFRIGNALLSAGYLLAYGLIFLRTPRMQSFAEGFLFVVALLLGAVPTLLANAINTGSPLVTSYGSGNTSAPDVTVVWPMLRIYLTDSQGVMLLIACGLTVLALCHRALKGLRLIAAMTAANIAVNMAYFLTYSIVTPYYIMPIAMLSLWTMLFAILFCTRVRYAGDGGRSVDAGAGGGARTMPTGGVFVTFAS